MINASQPTREEVWGLYKKIEEVVEKRSLMADVNWDHQNSVDRAIQRLCMAVLSQYKLDKNDYREFRYNLTIDKTNLPDLSTIDAMYNARIREWDRGRAGFDAGRVGHDDVVSSDGRPAGYVTRASLRMVYGMELSDLEALVNATPQAWNDRYLAVVKAVEGFASLKLTRALNHLQSAIAQKNGQQGQFKIDTTKLGSIQLWRYDTMLMTEFKVWQERIPPFTNLDYLFGREEGYYPQPSVAAALGDNLAKVRDSLK